MYKEGDKVRVCEVLGKSCKAKVLKVSDSWDTSEGFVKSRFDEKDKFDVKVKLLEDSSKGHKKGTELWIKHTNIEYENAWR